MVPQVRAEDATGTPQGGNAGLAQELSNPIADLITIPSQMNYDYALAPMMTAGSCKQISNRCSSFLSTTVGISSAGLSCR